MQGGKRAAGKEEGLNCRGSLAGFSPQLHAMRYMATPHQG